jgi:hypothetical protein
MQMHQRASQTLAPALSDPHRHGLGRLPLKRIASAGDRTPCPRAARIIPFVRNNSRFLRFNLAACDPALAKFGGVAELPVTFTRKRRRSRSFKQPTLHK